MSAIKQVKFQSVENNNFQSIESEKKSTNLESKASTISKPIFSSSETTASKRLTESDIQDQSKNLTSISETTQAVSAPLLQKATQKNSTMVLIEKLEKIQNKMPEVYHFVITWDNSEKVWRISTPETARNEPLLALDPTTRKFCGVKESLKDLNETGGTIQYISEKGEQEEMTYAGTTEVSHQELETFRNKFIAHMNDLNKPIEEEKHETTGLGAETLGTKSAPPLEEVNKGGKKVQNKKNQSSTASIANEESIKDKNEKRMKKHTEYMDEKAEIIKEEVENNEIKSQNYHAQDLSREKKKL